MAACANCGRDPDADDRFCARCGFTLGEDGTEVQPLLLTSNDNPLVARAADAVGREQSVRSGIAPGSRSLWVALAAGALVLGTVGWASTLGRSDDEISRRLNGLTEPVRLAGATPSTTDATGADDESSDDAADDDTAEDDEAEGDSDPTNRRERPEAQPLDSGPLLGEETGLGVVIGWEGKSAQLLDLDTGNVTDLEVGKGLPIGVIGTEVVFADTGAIHTLDLADPDAESQRLTLGVDVWPGNVRVRDDLIWTIGGFSQNEFRIRSITIDGVINETIEMPAGVNPWGNLEALPELVQSLPGGIYRRDDDSFDRLSGGLLLAAGDELVLVRECDEALVCTDAWYSRRSWEPMGYLVPEIEDMFYGARVLADRWLLRVSVGSTGERYLVSEILTGLDVAELPADLGSYGFEVSPSVSSDGRWMVQTSNRTGVSLFDLEDGGREWRVDFKVTGSATGLIVDLTG